VLGLTFDDSAGLTVLGVPFGRSEKLWYLGLLLLVAGFLVYRNLRSSRAGRALAAVREGETAAAAMGVDVTRYKAMVFALAAGFAGASGVFLALALQRLVPSSYDAWMAFNLLAMVVIGGLGTPIGAVIGAAVVTALPVLLRQYGDALPLLADDGTGGLTAGVLAQIVFGAALLLVLLYAPRGLAGLLREVIPLPSRVSRKLSSKGTGR
jgi:branched-chain amino acid transport system permease protein